MFQDIYTTYWEELLGAICIAPFIVYLLLIRSIQSSIAAGSMKF